MSKYSSVERSESYKIDWKEVEQILEIANKTWSLLGYSYQTAEELQSKGIDPADEVQGLIKDSLNSSAVDNAVVLDDRTNMRVVAIKKLPKDTVEVIDIPRLGGEIQKHLLDDAEIAVKFEKSGQISVEISGQDSEKSISIIVSSGGKFYPPGFRILTKDRVLCARTDRGNSPFGSWVYQGESRWSIACRQ